MAPHPRSKRVDPFALSEPWRSDVKRALAAANRFDLVASSLPAGPTRERLAGIGERVREAVAAVESWARRADRLGLARSRPSLERVVAELEHLAETAKEIAAALDPAPQLDGLAAELDAIRDGIEEIRRS